MHYNTHVYVLYTSKFNFHFVIACVIVPMSVYRVVGRAPAEFNRQLTVISQPNRQHIHIQPLIYISTMCTQNHSRTFYHVRSYITGDHMTLH